MFEAYPPGMSQARKAPRRGRLVAGSLLVALVLVSTVAVPVSAVATAATVAYGDFFFTPNVVTMSLDLADGNRVTFAGSSETTARHQPHSDPHVSHIVDAPCFESPVLNPGDSLTVVVNPVCAATGRVDYHCHIHPASMTGTLLFTYDFLG